MIPATKEEIARTAKALGITEQEVSIVAETEVCHFIAPCVRAAIAIRPLVKTKAFLCCLLRERQKIFGQTCEGPFCLIPQTIKRTIAIDTMTGPKAVMSYSKARQEIVIEL